MEVVAYYAIEPGEEILMSCKCFTPSFELRTDRQMCLSRLLQ